MKWLLIKWRQEICFIQRINLLDVRHLDVFGDILDISNTLINWIYICKYILDVNWMYVMFIITHY